MYGPKAPTTRRKGERRISPRLLVIPYPDPDTLTIIRAYARRVGLDQVTAAEHLITYGARSWLRARRAGQASAALKTPEQHEEHMRRAITARWARARAQAPSPSPTAPEPDHSPNASKPTER